MKALGKKALASLLAFLMVVSVFPLWLINFTASAENPGTDETMNELSMNVPVPSFIQIGGKYYLEKITVGTVAYSYGEWHYNGSSGMDQTIYKTVSNGSGGSEVVSSGLEYIVYSYGNSDYSPSWTTGMIIRCVDGVASAAIPDNWDDYRTAIGDSLNELFIMDGVTGVGTEVFANNIGLKYVHLADSVTTLGTRAFAGCGELISINLSHVESVGDSCFYAYDNLCSDFMGALVTSSNVLYGGMAVATASGATLKYIGENAFRGCTKLKKIYVGSGASADDKSVIKGYAFYNINVNSIVYGDNISFVGYHHHTYSYSLKSLTFGKNNDIGKLTCYYCYNLNTLNIGEGSTIGERAFDLCTNLTSSEGKSYLDLSGVTSIGARAFRSNSYKLKEVKFSTRLVSMGEYAFADCSSLESADLLHVSLSEIPKGAFERTSLSSVIISKNVVKIGEFAFSAFMSAGTERSGYTYCAVNGSQVTGTGLAKLKTVQFELGSVCSVISDYAFYRQSITSISFPDTIYSIGAYAFYYAGNLGAVTIPAGSSSVTVGGAAFEGTNITSLTILAPNNFSAGNWAFANNPIGTLSISATDSVSFGSYCFWQNRYLETLNINSTKASIGSYCFSMNTAYAELLSTTDSSAVLKYATTYQSLKEFNFTGSQLSVGDYAFQYCRNLKTLNLTGITEASKLSLGRFAFGHYDGDAYWSVNDPLLVYDNEGREMKILIRRGLQINLGDMSDSGPMSKFISGENYYMGNSYTSELIATKYPTCTENGKYTYKMTIVEGTASITQGSVFYFDVPISALGHMYSDEVFNDADCVWGEYAEKHCIRGCVSSALGVDSEGYALADSSGTRVTSSCVESGYTVITETENTECLNHEYYAGDLWYKEGIELDASAYTDLGEDQKSNFFMRYKHNTENTIITAYAYSKLSEEEQANYHSLYVGTYYLSNTEYNKLSSAEQEGYQKITVGKIVYGDINVNDGAVTVQTPNGQQTFTSPFVNYIAVYIEYGCYRNTHHVLTDTETVPYRVAYLPVNLTGNTDQTLSDIPLQLKNLGWADGTTSLAGGNGTRTYTGIYICEGNGVDVFKDVELDVDIDVSRVEIDISSVTLNNLKQSTAVSRVHVTASNLPEGASAVENSDKYYDGSEAEVSWSDIETRTDALTGSVNYKISFRNDIYDLIADNSGADPVYWVDGVYNSSGISDVANFTEIADGYSVESITVTGNVATVEISHQFLLQTPSLEIVTAEADNVTYDGNAHGFTLENVPASSAVTITRWDTDNIITGAAYAQSPYSDTINISAPEAGKTVLNDLRTVEDYNALATAAGTYYYRVDITNSGYSGNYGSSTYSFIVTVVIHKAALDIPTGASYVYDGTAKTGFTANAKYTIDPTHNTETNAGTYNVTLTLTDSNYYWTGLQESTLSCTSSWVITKMIVSVPTVYDLKRSSEYTGYYQSPLNLSPVNTVDSTGIPKNGDYKTEQDTTDKKKLNVYFYYNSAWHMLYQLNNAYGLNVGSTAIVASTISGFSGLFDTANVTWPSYQNTFSLGYWEITKADLDNPVIILEDKEYDGEEYDCTPVLSGSWNLSNENGNVFNKSTTDIVYEYYNGSEKLTEAPTVVGVYTVKANVYSKLLDQNYNFSETESTAIAYATGTFQITKAKVTLITSNAVVDSTAYKSYTGSAQELPEVIYLDSDNNPIDIPDDEVVLRYYKTNYISSTGVYELDETDAGTTTAPTFTNIGTYVYMVAIDSMVDNYMSVNYATAVLIITKADQGITVEKYDANALPTLYPDGSGYTVYGNLGDEPLVLKVSAEFDKASVLSFSTDESFGQGSSPVSMKTEAGSGFTLLTISFNQMTEGAEITVTTPGTANAGAATSVISVKVAKARPTVTVSSALRGQNAAYTGNSVYTFSTTVTGTSCVSLYGTTSSVPFTVADPSANCSLFFYTDYDAAQSLSAESSAIEPVDAGQYWVVARFNGDGNYLTGFSSPINITIGKAELTVNGYANVTKTYDGQAAELIPSLTVSGNGSDFTRKSAATTTVGEYWIEYYPIASKTQPEATLEGWTTTCPSIVNVASSGTYWFRVNSENYTTETRSITVTVEKVSVNVSAASTIELTRQYDGTDTVYSKTHLTKWDVDYYAVDSSSDTIVAAEISKIQAEGKFPGGQNVTTNSNIYLTYTVVPGTGFDSNNYLFNTKSLDSDKSFQDNTTFKGSITKRELTVTGLTAEDRQYDGTKLVKIDGSNAVVTGFVSGEYITYSYNPAISGRLTSSAVGTFSVENYVSGNTVYSDYTDLFAATASSGTYTTNYTIKTVNFPTATVSKRDTKIDSSAVPTDYSYNGKAITGYDKAAVKTVANTYNTDDSAVTSELAALSDSLVYTFYKKCVAGVPSEPVMSGSVNVAPTIAGTYYLVVSFAGDEKYNPSESSVITIEVETSDALDVTFDESKTQWTYDGDVHSFADMVKTVNGTTADGSIDSSAYTAVFYSDKAMTNVVTGIKNVKSSGTYYYKVSVSNYKDTTGSFTVTVSKKDVTITKPSVAVNKTYDGTTSVAVSGTTVVSGAVKSETIIATASAVYNDADVEDADEITITYAVNFAGGADPENYTFTAGTTSAAAFTEDSGNYYASETIEGSIAQKALSIYGMTANSRVYDGTNKIDLVTSTATLNGVISDDIGEVELNYIPTTGIVSNIHYEASAKTVEVVWSSATLKGTKAGNYTVTSGAAPTVKINKATPSIDWIGTLVAGWSGAPVELSYYEVKVLGNETPNEILAQSSTGITYTFWTDSSCTSPAVAGHPETAPTSKGNYYVKAYYAGSNDYTSYYEGKDLTITATGIYGTDSQITANNRTYDGTAKPVISSADVFSDLVDAALNHTRITTTKNAKIYLARYTDGEERPEETSSAWYLAYGYENGSLITTGLYTEEDAGTYTYWIKIVADDHAACYYYGASHSETITLTIEKATLTVGSDVTRTKVYDGKKAAAVSNKTITGIQSGDNITLTATAAYTDKNVGTGKNITVTYVLSFNAGTKASNYNVVEKSSAVLTASGNSYSTSYTNGAITKKSVYIKGITATDRIYDNTTSVKLGGTPVSSDGLCKDDDDITDELVLNLVTGATGTISNAKPGKYTVSVDTSVISVVASSADIGNYTIVSVESPSVTISKKQLELTFGGNDTSSGIAPVGALTDKTFTNKAMVLAALENAKITKNVEGGAEPSAVVYTYWTDSSCTSPAVAGSAAIAPTSTGIYYVKAETATTEYYLGAKSVAKVEIKNASLSLDVTGYTGTYDGAAHSPATVVVTGIDGNAITDFKVTFYKDSARTQPVSSVKNYSDSGTYYYTVTYDNYSESKGSFVVGISRIEVVLSSSVENTKTYDASSSATVNSASVYVTDNDARTALVNSEFGISAVAYYNNKNAAKNKTITVVYTMISSSGLLENYTLNGQTLKATESATYCTDAEITKKAVTITGVAVSSKDFDNTTKAAFTGKGTAVGLIPGDDVKLVTSTAVATFDNANAATGKTVSFSGYTLDGTDAGNYSLSQPDSLTTGTINRKNISGATVVLSGSLVYNGNAQTQEIASVKIDGLDVTTYIVSDAIQTNANTYTLTITGTDNFTGSVTKNYTIDKATYDMSGITFEDLVSVYDGTAHRMSIDGVLPVGSDGYAVTVSYIGSQTNVGSSSVRAVFATSSSNYYTPDEMTAVMTVSKRAIEITPDDNSKVYGDADPTATYTVTSGSVVSGEKLKNIVISRNEGENKGTYTWSIDSALAISSNTNYEITVKTGELEILAREIEIGINNQTHEYNNAEPWTGNKQTSSSATYWTVTSGAIQNNERVKDTKDSLKVVLTKSSGINVGKYTISGEYDNANYVVTFSSGIYSITPRDITIAIGNAGDIYGSTPDINNVALNAIKNGSPDSVANSEIETIRAALTNFRINASSSSVVGTYTVTADSKVYGNYNVTASSGIYTVTKRPITIEATDLTKVYDTDVATLIYSIGGKGLVNGDEVDVKLSSLITKTYDVGSTAIVVGTVTMSNGIDKTANYEITKVNGTYTVTPASFLVTFAKGSGVHGTVFGTDFRNSIILTNVQSGREMIASNGNAFDGTITWSSSSSAIATVDSTGLVTSVNVGNVKITVTFAGSKNYTIATASYSYDLVIAPAGSISASVTGYNGTQVLTSDRREGEFEPVNLVTIKVLNPDYEYALRTYYSLDGGITWTEEIPSSAVPGTYTIKVKIVDDADHYGDFEATVTAVISERTQHEVTFITNGGTITGSASVYVTDGVYLTADKFPTASRNGYVFAGWKNLSTGAVKTADEWAAAKVVITSATFFEAVYTMDTFTAETDSSAYIYTGSEITPAVSVKCGSSALTAGVDYEVYYEHNVNVGTATVTVIGIGEYTGFTTTTTFAIVSQDISTSADVEDFADRVYNGKAQTPKAVVRIGSTLLTEGTDYTVAYADNVNVGSAKVTITFIGNYTGTYETGFAILPKTSDISTVLGTSEVVYNGSVQSTAIVVTDGSSAMVEGVDYTVVYRNSKGEVVSGAIAVDVYTIEIVGMGNYAGILDTETFIVRTFSTTAHFDKSTVTKTYGDAAFVNTLIIDKSTEHGNVVYTSSDSSVATVDENGKVTINGVGTAIIFAQIFDTANTTSESTSFTLTVAQKSSAANTIEIKGNFEYTGEEITPVIIIKDGDKTLTEGVDYVWSSANNVNVGSASIYVEYIGNYKGTLKTSFDIVPKQNDISGRIDVDEVVYDGKTHSAAIVVTDGSTVLTEGVDYTVVYKNSDGQVVALPCEVDTYTVEIVGIGNYDGTLTELTFTVKNHTTTAAFSSATMNKTFGDAIFSNDLIINLSAEHGKVTYTTSNSNVATVDANGNITITGIGTAVITAEIAGSDNTTSAVASFTLTVTPKASTDNSVEITGDFEYTGEEIKPVVVIKDGDKTLTEGVDYDLAYANNVNVGSASLYVTYKGNYTGTQEFNYTITPYENRISVAFGKLSFVYSGSRTVPTVTVRDGDTVLIEGSDFTVSYTTVAGTVVTDPKDAGSYVVKVSGTGNYSGVIVTATYEITPAPVTAEFESSTVNKTFTDADFTNGVEISATDGKIIYTSSDPTVATVGADGKVTIVGIGTATIKVYVGATNNYQAVTAEYTLTVSKKSGTENTIEIKGDFEYTGEEIVPFIIVKDGDTILTEGVDYVWSSANNVNVGSASIYVEYIGNYSGTLETSFEIIPKSNNISGTLEVNEVVYDGKVHSSATVVCDGSSAMTEGYDYTVVYRNSKGEIVDLPCEVDTYTVEIVGMGNFEGVLTEMTFVVRAHTTTAEFSSAIVDKTFGDEIFVNPVIIDMAGEHGKATYTTSNSAVATVDENGNITIVGIGTAVITAEIAETDNTTSATAFFTLTVNPKPSTDNSVEISGNFEYTGEEINPNVVIRDGDKTLTEGVDYEVSYINNINVGTASVIITYKGNYSGSQTVNYSITPYESRISAVLGSLSFVYNGKTQVPSITLKDGDVKLVNGRDYTVTYTTLSGTKVKAPSDAGNYTVKVTGIGNYTGALVASTFEITPAKVSANFAESIVTKTYTDADFTNTLKLDKATDGDVIYTSSDTSVATIDANGKVTIVGIGTTTIKVYVGATNNYQSTSAEYTLTVKSMAVDGFTVDPIAKQYYTGSAITPRVTVRNGSATLIEGRDYTLSFSDNTAVGTAKVTVTGIGSYTGSINATFDIYAGPFAFELGELESSVYEDTAVEPKPEIKYAGVTLEEGKDYTIQYFNNDRSGTAYYTVTGIGLYEGLTATGVFEILNQNTYSEDTESPYYIVVKRNGGFGGDVHIEASPIENSEVATEGKKISTSGTFAANEAATAYASYTEDELKKLVKGKKNLLNLDIKLMSGNVEITEYEGVYTVKLLLPEELSGAEEIQVACIGSTGITEIFDTKVEDGYIVFDTTYFGEFQFLGKNFEFNWWWIVVICFVLCATTVVICIVITKKKDDEDGDTDRKIESDKTKSGKSN